MFIVDRIKEKEICYSHFLLLLSLYYSIYIMNLVDRITLFDNSFYKDFNAFIFFLLITIDLNLFQIFKQSINTHIHIHL